MSLHRWLVWVGLGLVSAPSFAESPGCGLPDIAASRELHQFLGRRAVEVVRRAANPGNVPTALVAPTAHFTLGAGDVGRPLGVGIDGARELARLMHADTYRFLGWDYMDMPVDACSKREVEVEFIDSGSRRVSRIRFTFEAGRVVGAVGWERSFESGPL